MNTNVFVAQNTIKYIQTRRNYGNRGLHKYTGMSMCFLRNSETLKQIIVPIEVFSTCISVNSFPFTRSMTCFLCYPDCTCSLFLATSHSERPWLTCVKHAGSFVHFCNGRHGASRVRKHEHDGETPSCWVPIMWGMERHFGGLCVPPRQYFPVLWLHGWQWLLWTTLSIYLFDSGLLLFHSLGLVGLLHNGLFPVEFCTLRGMLGTSPACCLSAEECVIRQGIWGASQLYVSETRIVTHTFWGDRGLLWRTSPHPREKPLFRHRGKNCYW